VPCSVIRQVSTSSISAHAPSAPAALPVPPYLNSIGCLSSKLTSIPSASYRSEGAQQKATTAVRAPHKFPRAPRLPPSQPPPLAPPLPFLTAGRSHPRSDDDGGLLAKLELPAPWKEPTDRSCEYARRGLPSKTPRQKRARPATAAAAAVANARAAALSCESSQQDPMTAAAQVDPLLPRRRRCSAPCSGASPPTSFTRRC
jgi:hypothetical protein